MNSAPSSLNGDAETVAEPAAASDRCAAPPVDNDKVWTDILARWNELQEYLSYFLAANLDRLRLTFRTVVMWSVLAVVVGLTAVAVIAAASVLLVVSVSTGVGQLLGGRLWLGQLVVSSVILIAASGGVWLALRRGLRAYQRNLIDKYERRKQHERAQYGTNVEQRAEERPKEAQPAVE